MRLEKQAEKEAMMKDHNTKIVYKGKGLSLLSFATIAIF